MKNLPVVVCQMVRFWSLTRGNSHWDGKGPTIHAPREYTRSSLKTNSNCFASEPQRNMLFNIFSSFWNGPERLP